MASANLSLIGRQQEILSTQDRGADIELNVAITHLSNASDPEDDPESIVKVVTA